MSLLVSFIIMLTFCLLAGFCNFYYLRFKAEKDLLLSYQEANNKLKIIQNNLEEAQNKFNQQKNLELASISQKKSDAIAEYERACHAIKFVQKIEEYNKGYVKSIENQMNKLRSELHNARKRAERLARRCQKAENNE